MINSSNDYAVEMTGISKFFPRVKALDNVDLKVKKGTVHALLGENGAGKSTLMKVLYGLYNQDAGQIKINGQEVQISDPKDALKNGIGMVHQHFMLVENFTIGENIALGQEITQGIAKLNIAETNKRITALGKNFGLEVNPRDYIQDIPVATQQRVEILKALYRGVDILILDEPTAVLTPQEIDSFFETLRSLVNAGKTIIIITHKLKEIKAIADKCTVLRSGKLIGTVDVKDVSENDLASMMVGYDIDLNVDKEEVPVTEEVLKVENLCVKDFRGVDKVKDFSFNVRNGEIVAIAGVSGNGQDELIEAITGLTKAESGRVLVKGQAVENKTPADVRRAGIATIHEDRHKRGLVLDFNIAENFILESYAKEPFSKNGILKWPEIFKYSDEKIEEFDIRPRGATKIMASNLSGGNQQKVIIAREIDQDPELLIACQPTRGLDVGAIHSVYEALLKQRAKGKAILLVSLELEEVFALADRIIVMYDGRNVAELDPRKTDDKEIGLLMAGGKNEQ
ncbi:ABC transporter ATP-binding protein [Neofamilia massiliensis]|uniref:ABC transporter ATP-binding protein n=1 Tax=Neofamilia massiliensis TaxID=1673724 RepID=UPI0006BB5979|nr:ABC transporter ATP-binding protein [Neofamilia massiliensis]